MDEENLEQVIIEIWEREYPGQSIKPIGRFDWEIDQIHVKDIKTYKPKSISKAKNYYDLMLQGQKFPPIVVLRTKKNPDKFRLIDGFHRMWGYKKLNTDTVTAYIGTRKKNEDKVP